MKYGTHSSVICRVTNILKELVDDYTSFAAISTFVMTKIIFITNIGLGPHVKTAKVKTYLSKSIPLLSFYAFQIDF